MHAEQPIAVVFTIPSLGACLERELPEDWFNNFQVLEDGSWGVLSETHNGVQYILDAAAANAQTRIVISIGDSGFFSRLNPAGLIPALQRIHRIAIHASKRRMLFPRAWSQYSSSNLITVFAYPENFGSERFVVQIVGSQRPDTYFCAVTNDESTIDLDRFHPNSDSLKIGLSGYESAAESVANRINDLGQPQKVGIIDLDALGSSAVTSGRTYSTWIPLLSDNQRKFVLGAANASLKVRGPAGSGKTLAMALKALRECYEALQSNEDIRVLYVTHSWSVAEQAQNILEQLDERGVLSKIDVLPLLTLAELAVESNRSLNVLGEDSHSGKMAQLRALDELLSVERRRDWVAYRGSCSPSFVTRVMESTGTDEANRFLWDIMLEFACVIGANGILPGLNAQARYKKIERRPWMMSLENDAEKDFIFLLYTRFIAKLQSNHLMTSDQVVSDYLNFLSTYRWHSERATKGYDILFVDEFHLFNEQERMVFHWLTRNPEEFPVVYMALDPRQSPSETYAEFAVPNMKQASGGSAESTLSEPLSIDLREVFRYTPEILAFLQSLDQMYPSLELGSDWSVSVSDAFTARQSGEVPVLNVFSSSEREVQSAFADAQSLADVGMHVAILSLDTRGFDEMRESVRQERSARFQLIESRDDVEKLRYSRRSIVVSQPQYVAGLQFDAVVLTGCRPTVSQYSPYQSYSLRRVLSDIYLGASRARNILHLYGSGTDNDFSPIFQSAINKNALRLNDV